MISVDLARRLTAAGIAWHPRPGDRFALPDRGLDEQVFVLSDMTVDVLELEGGPVIGFNGTVEWALDSVRLEEAVWLPHEAQLRDLLGATFRSLVREGDVHTVTCAVGDTGHVGRDPDPACAYAKALLAVLGDPGVDK